MKVVTFFSGKGGVGKTTMTAMFASYLRYKKEETVMVMDFDMPVFNMMQFRRRDRELCEDSANSMLIRLTCESPSAYKIALCPKGYAVSEKNRSELVDYFRRIKDHSGGYYLLDFPGSFLDTDVSYTLLKSGVIDLAVLMADSDPQSIQSVLMVDKMLKESGFPDRDVVLWNKETRQERTGKKDWYEEPAREFENRGIPVLSKKMHEIDSLRRESDANGFLRSTVCWPQSNINKNCRYIEEIFEEIKAIVDK